MAHPNTPPMESSAIPTSNITEDPKQSPGPQHYAEPSMGAKFLLSESEQQVQPVIASQGVSDNALSMATDQTEKPRHRSRVSRSVVPGLPRAKTFKRQLSEQRSHLLPVDPTPDERRAVSMDRRLRFQKSYTTPHVDTAVLATSNPRIASTDFPLSHQATDDTPVSREVQQQPDDGESSVSQSQELLNGIGLHFEDDHDTNGGFSDTRSVTTSQSQYEFDDMISHELESVWILNLSMRYKDLTNREKFFVTYRLSGEDGDHWRRVTVTLDYRNAPDDSLEKDVACTSFQRDKSAKIYEAIRPSLQEIQFFDTVTNLRLETKDERLHVHVVEDANEIIHYPSVNQVAHLGCRRIREQDITFDHHMSGFVYKVNVHGRTLIKKEIPGPDTIEEFLYEVNALNSVSYSEHVIDFYGLVVDEHEKYVKGLLISFADGGALIDVIYDNCKDRNAKHRGMHWSIRERWARQIVHGLADIHESGFVQGDFTLSNIVIDEHDDAKIIDVNRRGCPVGWEPPEATPLIESHHRISMYIGVKSDLFQLGMVLWALAMGEDEPEREGRPLTLSQDDNIPDWYRAITETCLNPDPRKRLQASMLLTLIPGNDVSESRLSISDADSLSGIHGPDLRSNSTHIRRDSFSYTGFSPGSIYTPTGPPAHQSWHYAPRGRSPPSPLPSNIDDGSESHPRFFSRSSWAANTNIKPSYSDVSADEIRLREGQQLLTPSASSELKKWLDPRDLDGFSPRPQSMERLRPIDTQDAEKDTKEEDASSGTISTSRILPETAENQAGVFLNASLTTTSNHGLEEISHNIQRKSGEHGKPIKINTLMKKGLSGVDLESSTGDEGSKADAIPSQGEGTLCAALQKPLGDGLNLDLKDKADASYPNVAEPTDSRNTICMTVGGEGGCEITTPAVSEHPTPIQVASLLQSEPHVLSDKAGESTLNPGAGVPEEKEKQLELELAESGDKNNGLPISTVSQSEPLTQTEMLERLGETAELISADGEEANDVGKHLSRDALPRTEAPVREAEDRIEALCKDLGGLNETANYSQQAKVANCVSCRTDNQGDYMPTAWEGLGGETQGTREDRHSATGVDSIENGEKTRENSVMTPQLSSGFGRCGSDMQEPSQSFEKDADGSDEANTDYSITSCEFGSGKQNVPGWTDHLVGIGAGHLDIDDGLLLGKDINEEDFRCLAPSEAQPTPLTTTDL